MALPISILKNILNFKCMHVNKCEIIETTVQVYGENQVQKILKVKARPFKRYQRLCPICKKKCCLNGIKQKEESHWRAPNLNGMPVYIYYQPHRILCPEHGALNEYIPWADGKSRFTPEFNDEIAWMTCRMPKTDICMYHNINWRTVGNCFDAAHKRHEPDVSARIHDNVVRICVDETSYKKGHKYITVVYDMDKNKVIWIHEGYGKEVFEEFCTQLSEEERSRIEIVAGDGAKWIDSCTKKYFPNAIRCIDFFHVVQWVNNSLDDVRINTSRKATREYNKIKDNFIKAEAEEAEAFANAEEEYEAAVAELRTMPSRGRRSKRYKELQSFVLKYIMFIGCQNDKEVNRKKGRPKKEQFTPEHEAVLEELVQKMNDVKYAKHALGHNPENRNEKQNEKIKMIENSYPDLYMAYQLKEDIRLILHMKDHNLAEYELDSWIKKAKACGLNPMSKLADKIERHRTNILNSIEHQANSAKSESTNTTIKYLIKLARGFRTLENMFALIYLKCSDIIIPLCNRLQPSIEYIRKQKDRALERKRAREAAKNATNICS